MWTLRLKVTDQVGGLWADRHIIVSFRTAYFTHRSSNDFFFFFMAQYPPSGPVSPHCRGFTVPLSHITLVRTLDEWSTWRRDFHLTTHNTDKDILPPSGIRTRNPRKRSAADPHIKPRGRWDRLSNYLIILTRLGEEYKLQSSSIFIYFLSVCDLNIKLDVDIITREVVSENSPLHYSVVRISDNHRIGCAV